MRKLFLLSVVAGLFFAACGTKPVGTSTSDSTKMDTAKAVKMDTAKAVKMDTAK